MLLGRRGARPTRRSTFGTSGVRGTARTGDRRVVVLCRWPAANQLISADIFVPRACRQDVLRVRVRTTCPPHPREPGADDEPRRCRRGAMRCAPRSAGNLRERRRAGKSRHRRVLGPTRCARVPLGAREYRCGLPLVVQTFARLSVDPSRQHFAKAAANRLCYPSAPWKSPSSSTSTLP